MNPEAPYQPKIENLLNQYSSIAVFCEGSGGQCRLADLVLKSSKIVERSSRIANHYSSPRGRDYHPLLIAPNTPIGVGNLDISATARKPFIVKGVVIPHFGNGVVMDLHTRFTDNDGRESNLAVYLGGVDHVINNSPLFQWEFFQKLFAPLVFVAAVNPIDRTNQNDHASKLEIVHPRIESL